MSEQSNKTAHPLFTPYLDGRLIVIKLPVNGPMGYVNTYAFEDSDGWTLIDCGYDISEHKEIFKEFVKTFIGRQGKLKRIIVTHYHPDHIGLCKWLISKTSAKFYMSKNEHHSAKFLSHNQKEKELKVIEAYYIKHGFSDKQVKSLKSFFKRFGQHLPDIPDCEGYLHNGEKITLAGTEWDIITVEGHSPEQITFFSKEHNVYLSTDAILQKTTPNISVWAYDEAANPIRDYFKSFVSIQRHIKNNTEIFPGHGQPFSHGYSRLNAIQIHHQNRREKILRILKERGEQTLAELLPKVFSRILSESELAFAIGELHAHLNFLKAQKHVVELNNPLTSRQKFKATSKFS